MAMKKYRVLFVCSGNAARSLFAEALLNTMAGDKFEAFSAGSAPMDAPHPLTLEVLTRQGMDTSSLYSKGLEHFTGNDAPHMDFIFTLCDKTAGEGCPVMPGQPITAHWGFPDPTAIKGDDEERIRGFVKVEKQIATRLRLFVSLPMDKIERMSLQDQLRQWGSDN